MRARNPRHLYLALQAAGALASGLVFTASSVYFVTVVHLDPLQLVLVGTVLEITCFSLQLPTGVLADVFSRRLLMISGYGLMGLGFLLQGWVPTFAAILLAQVLWGAGVTCLDGATEAWVSGELGDEGLAQIFTRGGQARQVGLLVGIPLAVLAGVGQVNRPILPGGVLFLVIAGLATLLLPERGFTPAQVGRGGLGELISTARAGLAQLRRRPRLARMLIFAIILGLCSEGYDRLWQAHMILDLRLGGHSPAGPLVLIGALKFVSVVVGLGALELSHRRLASARGGRLMAVMAALAGARAACMIALGLTGSVVAGAAAFMAAEAFRDLSDPLFTAWLTRSGDARLRATVVSLSGQADALGQIAGGPVIGLVGRSVSIAAALVASGAMLVPAIPLLLTGVTAKDDA